MRELIDPTAERFYSYVVPEPNSGCWLWIGATDKDGYGVFRFRSKQMKAHRVAWLLNRGEIDDGSCVCHRCDTPPCVNDEHLFVGTNAENLADSARKGRKAGERNGRAILTVADVVAIRLAGPSVPAEYWAKHFGVCAATVCHARRGFTWTR